MTMITLIVLSLLMLANAEYSDDLGRNYMFPLSAAAYSSNPQRCLTNRFGNAKLIHQYTVECDNAENTCSAFTAVLPAQNAIVFSFRGTADKWVKQLAEQAKECTFRNWTNWPVNSKVELKVCHYFAGGAYRLWNAGMGNDADELINKFKDYKIWITGHSLEGAMADLFAAFILDKNVDPKRIEIVTFGQPRVGNRDFANWMNGKTEEIYRVVHSADIVPHVPLLPQGYLHHGTEIYYPGDMNRFDAYNVCNDEGNKECSGGKESIFWGIPDHQSYYGKKVSDYGIRGCPEEM